SSPEFAATIGNSPTDVRSSSTINRKSRPFFDGGSGDAARLADQAPRYLGSEVAWMNDPVINLPAESVSAGAQQFRSQVGHISRHSGVYFAGTLFTVALGYIFKVYLARVLGAEALGTYALGLTLVGFIGTFNSLGLVTSAVRFAA